MLKHSQVQYAMERIKEISRDKAQEIADTFEKAETYNAAKLVSDIKSGKVKLAIGGDERVRSHCYIRDIFVVPFPKCQNVAEMPEYKKRYKALKAEVARVSDNLMLGDSKAALEAIEKLSKAKF